MKTLHYSLWGGLLLLTGAWLFSESTPFAALNGFFAWRGVLNQYTGVLAMGVMSLAVILAVRHHSAPRLCTWLTRTCRRPCALALL